MIKFLLTPKKTGKKQQAPSTPLSSCPAHPNTSYMGCIGSASSSPIHGSLTAPCFNSLPSACPSCHPVTKGNSKAVQALSKLPSLLHSTFLNYLKLLSSLDHVPWFLTPNSTDFLSYHPKCSFSVPEKDCLVSIPILMLAFLRFYKFFFFYPFISYSTCSPRQILSALMAFIAI